MTKTTDALVEALERIADPKNTHFAGDAQVVARDALEQLRPKQAEPLFWYRPCSDGEMYEGPIHNVSIERVRKESGGWKPLYTHPPQPAQAVPEWQPTDQELTAIYKAATGEDKGKPQPLTTSNIFKAMRAMIAAAPPLPKGVQ